MSPTEAKPNSCFYVLPGKEIELAARTAPLFVVNMGRGVEVFKEGRSNLLKMRWKSLADEWGEYLVTQKGKQYYVFRAKALDYDDLPKKFPVGLICF
jgi:hypothetical protein